MRPLADTHSLTMIEPGNLARNRSVEEVRKFLSEIKHQNVKVAFSDIDGVLRGKYMAKEKFLSALDDGMSFCDVIVGWDTNDQLYDSGKVTGWHTGFPDARMRIVHNSMRLLPFEDDMPFFLCEIEGDSADACARSVLRRVLKRLERMGLSAYVGAEYEFFLFNETPESVRTKGYRDLQPLTPGYFGYSILRSSVHSELYEDLLKMCARMEMPLEGIHTETGPGVIEAAIAYDDALRTADNAALFKTFTKVYAQRRLLMASFMAKWSERWPGQSGHLHLSLKDQEGRSVFHDGAKTGNVSNLMRHFIGGMQALLPELTCMSAPSINSYARLVPGFWAPTSATWGIENRTVALRVVPGGKTAQRVEYRIASADANPHLSIAAAVGSGLWGIENEIEPTDMIQGDAYVADGDTRKIPSSLSEATRLFSNSAAARDLFGDAFVDHFSVSRNWEVSQFRKHVTDWELERYFEII